MTYFLIAIPVAIVLLLIRKRISDAWYKRMYGERSPNEIIKDGIFEKLKI